MKKTLLKLQILVIILILNSIIFGEISPWAVAEMKEQSKECLEIEVFSVKKISYNERQINIEIYATILNVIRTDSNLKKGDSIIVRYVGDKTPEIDKEIDEILEDVGPAPVPILVKNKRYSVFLILNEDNSYSPSVGGYSFTEIIRSDESKLE